MSDDEPPFIPMDMSPGDRRPDDPAEPQELVVQPVTPAPEPAPEVKPEPQPEPEPAPVIAAAPPPPAPPPPPRPPFEIDPRPTWEPAPLAPRPPWRPPVPSSVGETEMESATMATTWDPGPPPNEPPPPPVAASTDAPSDAFVIDPDHFAIAETEDEDDLIQDRAVGWLGRLFGAQAELGVDANARAERTRGWTTRTILLTTITLLILNAHSLQTWAATLPPQWGSETLRLVSGEWAGQLQAVGLDEPRRRIHAAYQTTKTLGWDGSVKHPAR